MPSLDAASERLYRKINRPHHSLTLEMLIGGLKNFRAEYGGQLWAEVMLIKGLNDGVPELKALAAVLEDIGADEIHLLLPTRPPPNPGSSRPMKPRCNALNLFWGSAPG